VGHTPVQVGEGVGVGDAVGVGVGVGPGGTYVHLAVMVLLEFMVTVVFMALVLDTLLVQLFQVLQLALNEAFTLIVVLHGMLLKVVLVPPATVP